MKVNLNRFFRLFRKFLMAGGIAAATVAGSTGHAALVLSNGSFASPSVGTSYGSYFNGGNVTGWNAHNLYPGGGSNGNLNLMSEACQSTGGLSAGQYVLAQRAADPVAVFTGGVGNTLNPASNPGTNVIGSQSNGLYIDQTIGTLDSTDLTQSFSLSANLLRALGPTGIYYNVPPPTWAGAGFTIGFVNGNTGAILAQKTISYTQSYPASDTTTTFSATDAVTWNAAGSGLPVGTPINVFVGFRLNPGLGGGVDYNTVAANNLVLTSAAASSYPRLTWTGNSAGSPTQWSTNGSVLNWSNSGSPSAYTDGALVTFDDSVGTGSTTVAISAANVNPVGVIFNNSVKSYTLQGPFAIAGGAYLTVSGGGLVTITNSNSYTGGTNISNGTLKIGNGGSIGSGDIVVNGALIYNHSDSVSTLSTISGSGSLTQQGPGLLTLAGINTYTGATNISGGTLQIGNGDSATFASTSVVMSNSGALAFNHSTIANYSGAITGAGSVIKAGSGTLTLSGANNYTNGTTVNAGTLVLGGNSTYGGRTTVNSGFLYALSPLTGPATVNGGNLYANSSLAGPVDVHNGGVLGGSGTAGAVSVASGGGIEGGQNGIGTLTLTSLAYSGNGTFVTGGYANYAASVGVAPLNVTAGGGLNPGAGPVTINLGGPVATSSGAYHLIQYSGAIGGSGSAAFTLGSAPNISGRCALTYGLVNNPGFIDVAVSLTPVIWTGSLSSEWLATDTLPAPGNWTFNGGGTDFLPNDIVQFNNSSTVGSVDISSGDVLPAGVLVNSDTAHPYSFTGTNGIGGSASLTKAGASTLTISNINSYSGGTTVNGGVIAITTANFGLPAGTVVINAGGTVNFMKTNESNRGLGGRNFYIAGTGATGQGALIVTADPTTLSDMQVGNVTLTADATIGAYGGNGLNSGIHYGEGMNAAGNLNNHTLTLVGDPTAENALFSDYFTGTGTISVQSGNFRLNTSQSWTSGVLVINSGAQFATYNNNSWASPVVVNGGTLTSVVGILTLTGPVTLASDSFLNNGYIGGHYGGNVGVTLAGNVSGSGGLTLVGGAHVFSGSNNYTGDTIVSAGSLTLLNANALQGSSLVANAGALVILDSSVSTHAFNFGGLGGSRNLPLTDDGGNSVALTVGGNNHSTVYLGALSGGGSLSKVGTGSLTLWGANTYTGGTKVNAGVLNVDGSLAGAVTVNGGILGGSGSAGTVSVAAGGGIQGGYAGAGTLTLASLAYSGSGVLNIVPTPSNVPVIVSGSNSLTVSGGAGSVAVNVISPPVTSGAAPVIRYSGAIQGTGFSAFTLGTTPAGRSVSYGSLVNNPGEIDLNVVVTPVIWTGSTSTAWLATDTLPAPGNWTFNGGATDFLPNDIVQFNNSSNVGTVDISNGNVLPAAAEFNNDASHPYTITGVNGIGGAARVVKDGAGLVIMTASNSYTGGTLINSGTLQIGNAATNATIGSGPYNIGAGGRLYLNYATAVPAGSLTWSNDISGAGTVELNSAQAVSGSANWGPNSPSSTVFGPGFTGTLQVDNGRIDSSPAGLGGVSNIIINANAQFLAWSGTYSQALTLAGSGWGETNFPGALRAASGVVTTWMGPITLSANAGIEAQTGANLTLTGLITGNHQLEFESAGPGTINLVPSGTAQNSYGSTQVDTGATVVAGNQRGFSTGGLAMNGGVVETNGFNFSFANLSGLTGTIENSSSSAASTITVGADNTSTVYGGALADGSSMSLALTKTGSGMLTLVGSNGYSGATTVNGGTLQVGNVSAIPFGPGTGNVTVHSPAVLDVAGNLTNINGLSGNGTVDDSAGGGILVTGNNGAVTTFSGTIQNSNSAAGVLALKVVGGSLTLTGTNTYLGGTTVDGGTLIVTNSKAIYNGTNLTVGNPSAFPAAIVPAPAVASAAAVPEPGTLGLFAAVAAAATIGFYTRIRPGRSARK
jgi:autotransporter-associated beta strand protein